MVKLPADRFVYGSDYDVIKFWNSAQSGKHISEQTGFVNGISSMTMLNDGSTLVIAPFDSNETIRLININTGKVIKSIWGNMNHHELAVLNNGQLISAASDDSIIIWK